MEKEFYFNDFRSPLDAMESRPSLEVENDTLQSKLLEEFINESQSSNITNSAN